MPTTNPLKTILIVSNNQDLIETTRTNLASNDFNDLIVRMGNREGLAQIIAETQPKLILLDFDIDPEPIKLIQEAINAYPHIAFVPILTEAHMANADQILLTGARVFVKYPYQQDALILTVQRAMDYKQSEQINTKSAPTPEVPVKHGHVLLSLAPREVLVPQLCGKPCHQLA